MQPLLAITMGDINGVGPEILAAALARPEIREVCRPLVIGSVSAFNSGRQFAPECPPPQVVGTIDGVDFPADRVVVFEGGITAPIRSPGQLDAEAGRCAVEWVKIAVDLCLGEKVDGLVTCPINKEGIHRAGYKYPGHTELIAEMTGAADYRMSLFAGGLRVVHITSHMSLSKAIEQVKADRIAETIRIAHDALVLLKLPRRNIAVAALNPHAGEAGAFGKEEIEEIAPAVAQCIGEGIECSGPWPADTIFRRMQEGEFDLIVAMYHDQGHIPVKLVAMDEGVNVTLGIPIIRTSVDHGTAYDLAGTGTARDASLCAAIQLASQMATKPSLDPSGSL